MVERDFVGLITSSALHAHVAGHAARLGARMRFRARLNNFDAIGQMVAAGIGVAVMPEVAAKRCARSMKINVIRIRDPWANRRLAICARNFRALPKPAQQLVEHLQKDGAAMNEKENTQCSKIWGRRSSFNVQKVMWLIGELELAHEHIDAGGSAGGLDAPAFLAMNPHGRIPVIADGDAMVWESHAISGISPRATAPGDSGPTIRSRAPASTAGWTGRKPRCSRIFSTGVFWGFYRTPEDKRNWPAINAALARCARDFGKLDRLLEGRAFLLGETLSLADITAGTSLYRYFELEIERPKLPQVERWYRTLQQREAYRTHIMIPFGELLGRLDY